MWFTKSSKVTVEEKEDEDIDSSSLERRRGPLFTSWILEALSLLASMGCIIAIMVILSEQNNKPIPDWHGITINGVVSVLSDLAHAAMMYPVSEAIGQLKWIWYWNDKAPRRMTDFDVYNCATRGPFGSLWLLFKPRLWHFSSLGALLTIAALGMQFFLQLMPNFESRPKKVNQSARLAQCLNYTDWAYDINHWATLAPDPQAAITNGVYNFATAATTLHRTCDTGNCTWPIHRSLGICSACANVTEQLKWASNPYVKDGKGWAYGDLYYDSFDQFYIGVPKNIAWARLANFSIHNSYFLWWNVTKAEAKRTRPNAFHCILYYCVRTYDTAVMKGNLNETVISTWPNTTSPVEDLQGVSFLRAFDRNLSPKRMNYTIIKTPEEDVFNVTTDTTGVLNSYFSSGLFLGGFIEWGRIGYAQDETVLYQSIVYGNGPSTLLDNIAQSLSVRMRNKGQSTVAGDAFTMRTFVTVRWQWAILPLTLLGLALTFLIATVLMGASRSVPVWKNSSLPSLVYQLDGELVRNVVEHGPHLNNLEKQAQHYTMAMLAKGATWKLEGHATTKVAKDIEDGFSQKSLLPHLQAQRGSHETIPDAL